MLPWSCRFASRNPPPVPARRTGIGRLRVAFDAGFGIPAPIGGLPATITIARRAPGRQCQHRRHPGGRRRARLGLRSRRSLPVSGIDCGPAHVYRPQGELLAADHPGPELGAHTLSLVPRQRHDRPFLRIRDRLVGAVVYGSDLVAHAPTPIQLDSRPGWVSLPARAPPLQKWWRSGPTVAGQGISSGAFRGYPSGGPLICCYPERIPVAVIISVVIIEAVTGNAIAVVIAFGACFAPIAVIDNWEWCHLNRPCYAVNAYNCCVRDFHAPQAGPQRERKYCNNEPSDFHGSSFQLTPHARGSRPGMKYSTRPPVRGQAHPLAGSIGISTRAGGTWKLPSKYVRRTGYSLRTNAAQTAPATLPPVKPSLIWSLRPESQATTTATTR